MDDTYNIATFLKLKHDSVNNIAWLNWFSYKSWQPSYAWKHAEYESNTFCSFLFSHVEGAGGGS